MDKIVTAPSAEIYLDVRTIQGGIITFGYIFDPKNVLAEMMQEICVAESMNNIDEIVAYKKAMHNGHEIRWHLHCEKRASKRDEWVHFQPPGEMFSEVRSRS